MEINSPQDGTVLKEQNKDLVSRVADLKGKREELTRAIQDAETEKIKFEEHIEVVRKRIAQLQDSLDRKNDLRSEYMKIIQETEGAYQKILESSQSLLSLLEHETQSMQGKKLPEVQVSHEDQWQTNTDNPLWTAPEQEAIV